MDCETVHVSDIEYRFDTLVYGVDSEWLFDGLAVIPARSHVDVLPFRHARLFDRHVQVRTLLTAVYIWRREFLEGLISLSFPLVGG